MKKLILVVTVLVLAFSLTSAEPVFLKGMVIGTAQVGFDSWATPFGVNVEFAITENIGIAGNLMFASWSSSWFLGSKYTSTLITPSIEGAYHFTSLDVDKLDLYAGASLGYSIYSWKWSDGDFGGADTGASELFLSPFIAARYYFSEKLGVSVKANYSLIGGWSGVGGTIGVCYILKN